MFAASLESLLIFAAIILISALSNWVKRRQEHNRPAQPDTEPAPPLRRRPPLGAPADPTEGPQPARPFDWEEELRRFFEGERPSPKPAPPPPGLEPTPAPAPAPPPAPPVISSAPAPRPLPATTPAREAPSPARLATPVAPPVSLGAELARAERELAQLQPALAAQRAAVSRAGLATAHARTALLRRGQRGVDRAQRGVGSNLQAQALIAQLHQPQSARQAILAAAVLGSPKGLQP